MTTLLARNTTRLTPLSSVDCVPEGSLRGEDPRRCHEVIAALARAQVGVRQARRLAYSGTSLNHAVQHGSGESAVDGVVLVHYSRAPCRRSAALAGLRAHGLPWEPPRLHVAEHLDADDLTEGFLQRCVTRSLCTDVELSQASCTANHIYAWHVAARMGWRTTLFIEDDALLPGRFHAELRRRLFELAPGWLILNFACFATPPGTGSRQCSRGYVLSRAGVLAFKRSAGVIDKGADWLVYEVSAKAERDNQDDNVTVTHHGGMPPVVELSEDAARGRLPRGTDLCEDPPHRAAQHSRTALRSMF